MKTPNTSMIATPRDMMEAIAAGPLALFNGLVELAPQARGIGRSARLEKLFGEHNLQVDRALAARLEGGPFKEQFFALARPGKNGTPQGVTGAVLFYETRTPTDRSQSFLGVSFVGEGPLLPGRYTWLRSPDFGTGSLLRGNDVVSHMVMLRAKGKTSFSSPMGRLKLNT